jgi:DNA-binding winged helix-turn-helix (wHTH) protein/Tol biopolymer transport system component
MLKRERQLFEFGPFRIDPSHRLLLREDRPVPLQPKAFEILLVLVENSEKVVSKDDLMKAVWPDTFVEESNLTQHIFVLRKTLGDAVEEKRYIVTVPGRGYQFAGNVRVVDDEKSSAGEEDTLVVERHTRSQMVIEGAGLPPRTVAYLGSGHRVRPWAAILTAGLVVAVVAAVLSRPYVPAPRVVRIRQLTRLGTLIANMAVLTDGPRVYFRAWNGKDRLLSYVSPDGGEVFPLQPTLPEVDIYDISPSGAEFLVGDLSGSAGSNDPYTHFLWRAPVAPGSPRQLGGAHGQVARWSPDGSTIVYALDPDLQLINSDGTNSRKLATTNGSPWYPQWSPDGQRIRYSVLDPRGRGMELWEVDVAGKKPHRMLPDWPPSRRAAAGPWSPDGRYFFFTAVGEGTRDIWVMREPKSTWRRVDTRPVRLTSGPLDFYRPILSKDGKSILTMGEQQRGELLRYDRASKVYVPYAHGISADHVAFSPDRQWMAYVEYPQDILVRARLDGSERRQLTFPPMRAYHPQWSPDGSRLAFQVATGLGSAPPKIYIISKDGGLPVLATPERSERQTYPSWSSDGKSILFSIADEFDENHALYRVDVKTRQVSMVPGTEGLYWGQISPDGRHVVALTETTQKLMLYDTVSHDTRTLAGLADYPIWSGDGRYIYFSTLFFRRSDSGIFRLQLSTGEIEKLLASPEFPLDGVWGTWFGLTPDGDPLVVRNLTTSDLYALDLDLP